MRWWEQRLGAEEKENGFGEMKISGIPEIANV